MRKKSSPTRKLLTRHDYWQKIVYTNNWRLPCATDCIPGRPVTKEKFENRLLGPTTTRLLPVCSSPAAQSKVSKHGHTFQFRQADIAALIGRKPRIFCSAVRARVASDSVAMGSAAGPAGRAGALCSGDSPVLGDVISSPSVALGNASATRACFNPTFVG